MWLSNAIFSYISLRNTSKIHKKIDIHIDENENIMNIKPDIYTAKSLYDSSLKCIYETEE